MTSPSFPNPQRDEQADDAFEGPHDEFSSGTMGASPVDPVASARKPQRRTAIFLVAGALLVLLLILVMGGKGSTKKETAQNSPTSNGMVAAPVAAPPRSGVSATQAVDSIGRGRTPSSTALAQAPIIDPSNPNALSGTAGTPGRPPVRVDASQSPSTLAGGGALPPGSRLPTQSRGEGALPGDPLATIDNGSSIPRNSGPNAPAQRDNPVPFPVENGTGLIGTTPASPVSLNAARDELASRKRAQLQEATARAAAFKEYKKAEEARLKQQATMMQQNSTLMTAGNGGGGASRFGTSADQQSAVAVAGGGASGSASAANGQISTAVKNDILPGTRVSAVTVSEFVSDDQGAGQLEARLTQPLRTRSGVLLPAGTRAFGTANGGSVQVGKPARLTVSFDVFVTPRGEVVRGLVGKGIDPKTLATSVPGHTDQRYAERIARGALSTAIDLALTAKTQTRPNAFEQPSPRDRAIEDARARFGTIINGPIGTESSVRPTVTLPAETEIILQFGY